MWICFVMTPVQFKVSRFFLGLFLYLFHKPKHLFKTKHAVEAAKSNHLSLHRVKICLWKICSRRCRFTQNWVFCIRFFWRTKRKSTKTITERHRQNLDWITERITERVTDWTTDWTMDWTMDRIADRTMDRTTDQIVDWTMDRIKEKISKFKIQSWKFETDFAEQITLE